MSETFGREKKPTSEKFENEKYAAFQMTMDEEQRIMEEINNILATTQDRAEAEKIVLETLAPKMDKAIEESRQALHNWLEEIRE